MLALVMADGVGEDQSGWEDPWLRYSTLQEPRIITPFRGLCTTWRNSQLYIFDKLYSSQLTGEVRYLKPYSKPYSKNILFTAF